MGVSSTQVAVSTPFDNSTNDYTSDEVQSAIEETRFINRTITHDVTIPVGKTWLQRMPLILGNLTILATGELFVL